MAGKSVRKFLDGLGYSVHTPASVFGRERLDQGLAAICTLTAARKPNVYWLATRGVIPYERRIAELDRRRRD
jgi:hypothetical protein